MPRFAAIVYGFSLGVTLFAPGTVLAADRPNIVWLLSEDNSKHFLEIFDSHGTPTPNIQSLGEHGLIFDHAFSNAPVCSVARTTLMTGCYAPRIGTQYHRRTVAVPLPNELQMFPFYLRQTGYYTTNKQKKDYNAIEGEDVWDESSNRASWRNRARDQPFFHMQSFAASHESSLHFSAAEMTADPTSTDPHVIHLSPRHPDTPTFRYTYARYHDRIQQIDSQIGKIVDDLASDGVLEDTFVFYFGDHGGVLPGSKGYLYETGLHVPLVVRIPEKWKDLVDNADGHRVSGYVSFIDFAPTVLNLAGIPVPRQMDGQPFLGRHVKAVEVDARDEAYGYADRFDEKYDLVRSLRKGRYKYIRSFQPFNYDALQNNYRYRMLAYEEWRRLYEAGRLNNAQRQFFEARTAEALYDLEQDPYETHNLAADPGHATTLSDLRQRLNAWMMEMPDLSLYPESELVARAFDDPTGFGQRHRGEIAELLDVANLSCQSYADARQRIGTELEHTDPWHRYWGLVVCSSFGRQAAEFADRARNLSERDPEPLVRIRAAEFLGLTGLGDPRPAMMDALAHSNDPVASALILNSVVLLRDGYPGYHWSITNQQLNPNVRQNDAVNRRLQYLSSE
ncbi:MAG: sulfatase [Pirellulaceae bacterium]|nr:sulfatase [Planctomycetales bacterium]